MNPGPGHCTDLKRLVSRPNSHSEFVLDSPMNGVMRYKSPVGETYVMPKLARRANA